jgi:AraC-like DNA-binding protein
MKRRNGKEGRRNYKAEYRRRIKRGLLQGLSRSQARGHPKAKESHLIAGRAMTLAEHKFQIALRNLREGKSAAATARSLGLSPERFRRQLAVSGVTVRHGRRWQVREDAPREMPLLSNGRQIRITVPDLATAGEIGRYWNAVKQLRWNNEPNYLEPFVGRSVTDGAGKAHSFETDPNTIYELSYTGSETFEQVYRIVVT